jgi:hypothetical protein
MAHAIFREPSIRLLTFRGDSQGEFRIAILSFSSSPYERHPRFLQVCSPSLPGFWKDFDPHRQKANPVGKVTNAPHTSLGTELPVIHDTWKSGTSLKGITANPQTSIYFVERKRISEFPLGFGLARCIGDARRFSIAQPSYRIAKDLVGCSRINRGFTIA